MPRRRTHTKFNLFLGLPLTLGAILYSLKIPLLPLLIFSICFIYGTLYFSPDLDLANQIKFFSLKGILTAPFRLYSGIFRHRRFSHKPILGTLSRIILFETNYTTTTKYSDKINSISIWQNQQACCNGL